MLMSEVHVGDLTNPCPRRVQLRHEGKVIPQCGGAMYRGLLFHKAAELYHSDQPIDMDAIDDLVRADLARGGRRISDVAARDAKDTLEEVADLLECYKARFAGWFASSKIIAVEPAVRCTVDVDGEPVEFASHMDLLFRDPHGNLTVWDWKTGDTEYEPEYAHRSLQVGMYYHAVERGSVRIGGEWVDLNESPSVAFIEVDNLKPYGRKVTAKDESGVEKVYAKGDLRPLSSIVREVLVTNPQAIIDEFSVRVRMFRAGLYPTNPNSAGCRVCESAKWCPGWSGQPQEVKNENERADW